jgi:hypothetical protein
MLPLEALTALLQRKGWTGAFLAMTPRKMSSYKCNEVGWLLQAHLEQAALGFVAIDGDRVNYPDRKRVPHIQPDPQVGLTDEDVRKAAAILGVEL